MIALRIFLIFTALALPWLSPFAGGPSAAAVPWVVSLLCVGVMGWIAAGLCGAIKNLFFSYNCASCSNAKACTCAPNQMPWARNRIKLSARLPVNPSLRALSNMPTLPVTLNPAKRAARLHKLSCSGAMHTACSDLSGHLTGYNNLFIHLTQNI